MFWFGIAVVIMLSSTAAQGEILEERLANGSNLFVPTAFPLNPAANSTDRTLFAVQTAKRDEKINFFLNPGNNQAAVEEKVGKKDLAVGGQYPMGGAAIGLSYSEQRRDVTAQHENRNDTNHELFVNRDYRMNFAVEFTSALRGAFTFHYTALQSDLDGNFFISDADRTHYRGTQSGYGLGLYYNATSLRFGAFSHAPMRGKATVEGEQKIITEPGIYGLNADFIASPGVGLSFHTRRWSYKHDERDDPSTSPVDQRDILLRGLDLHQFYRKTFAYALAFELAATPMVFVNGQDLRQEGVFLFDPDRVPGDDKEQETKVKYAELRAGIGIKSRDFIANLDGFYSKASQGSIPSQGAGFGGIGGYEASTKGFSLMVGASF